MKKDETEHLMKGENGKRLNESISELKKPTKKTREMNAAERAIVYFIIGILGMQLILQAFIL